MKSIYYHVVTEKPMKLGQIITFDSTHHSGLYNRVYNLKDKEEDIYNNPEKYKDVELDHHTKVALRELALEAVRKELYSNYPSRLESLYVSKTFEEAENWYNYFKNLDREVFGIVKVEVEGNSFTGDACNCFEGTTSKEKNIELAKCYWTGKDNVLGKKPVYETIVSGNIKVVEIIKE